MGYDVKVGVLLMLLVLIAIIGFSIAILCMIFEKAGERAWKAIVPFYNLYILYKIVWGNGWLCLTILIPFGGALFSLVTYYKLGRVFGKGRLFSIALLVIPFIPMTMIAFGRAEYLGGSSKNLALGLTVSIVLGVVIMAGYGFYAYHLVKQYSNTLGNASETMKEFGEYFDRNMEIYRDSYDYSDEVEEEDKKELPEKSEEKKAFDGTIRLEYYDGYKVDVPVLKGAEVEANGSIAFYRLEDGTSVTVSLVATPEDEESSLDSYISNHESLVEDMEFYSGLKEYETSRKEKSVCKRLTYNYLIADSIYPMEYIAKVEDLGDDYYVIYVVEKDGYESESQKYWKEVLDLYGIGVN